MHENVLPLGQGCLLVIFHDQVTGKPALLQVQSGPPPNNVAMQCTAEEADLLEREELPQSADFDLTRQVIAAWQFYKAKLTQRKADGDA